MPTRLFWIVGLLWMLGCGGGDDDGAATAPPTSHGGDGGTGRLVCVDSDGDGFGKNCGGGADCDDDDPEVTDECRRCVSPNKGCPCETGMPPASCKPADMVTTMNGVQGRIVCSEGTRYCREDKWSDCEILWQYATFVPD